VSCEPGGEPTAGEATLDGDNTGAGLTPRDQRLLTRNLSENGNRVLFDTETALLPGDTNGQADVYEWEATNEGSCRSDSQDDGCLYLISTGTSGEPSYFGDASANGNDVFFFTRQQLASSDEDNNVDVYDARVCEAGDTSCEQAPTQPTVPCVGEACPGASPAGPPLVPSASSLLSGDGNLAPPPAKPKPKPELTRARKLALALKACGKDSSRKKRAACDARARRRYGAKSAARKSAGGHS
jgi:hypothetical protein